MRSLDTRVARTLSIEHQSEPRWSEEQAAIVEEMQCRRLEDLSDDEPVKAVEVRVEVKPARMMTCGCCLHLAEFRESRVCDACQADDWRDRGE